MKKIFFAHVSLFFANFIYAINYSFAKDVMPDFIQPSGFILLRVLGACILFSISYFLFVTQRVEKKGVSVMTNDQIEAGNKFLRDFVMLHNAMQAKIEQENRIRKVKADIAQAKAEWDAIGSQDTRRKKLEEIDRTWAAIQAIDTSGTVPR